MISRRSLSGTGHPGRQEYLSCWRVTGEIFAENFGGPVGVGVAVVGSGAVVGVAAAACGPVGPEAAEVGRAADVGWADVGWEVAVPQEAAARQPTVTASAARVRIVNLDLATRYPLTKTDKSDNSSL